MECQRKMECNVIPPVTMLQQSLHLKIVYKDFFYLNFLISHVQFTILIDILQYLFLTSPSKFRTMNPSSVYLLTMPLTYWKQWNRQEGNRFLESKPLKLDIAYLKFKKKSSSLSINKLPYHILHHTLIKALHEILNK